MAMPDTTVPPVDLPSAKEYRQKLAQVEAEEASKEAHRAAEAEAAKQALLDRLGGPSGVSDEEAIKRAMRMIEGAVRNHLTEVQVYRFPSSLSSDGGRAINQREAGWETTLVGIPKEIYDLWARYFRDKGYGLKVEIVDYPGGMPGDIVMTLKWI
jgi:hypothetical protein